MERYDAKALEELARRLLEAAGTLPDSAAQVADHVVDSELRGLSSHGLQRIPQYLELIGRGYIDPAGEVSVRQETALLRVDGGGGFGMPAMNRAVSLLAEQDEGLGLAAVTGVCHTGRIGRYAEDLAEAGRMAWVFGDGAHRSGFGQVAPYGGRKGFLSTNPHAFAFPGGKHGPMVADFATSATAQGKVAVARDKDEELPPGLLIDKEGRPSRDPKDYFAGGALLPAAGPKGYGMGLLAELAAFALLGQPKEFNWLILSLPVALFRDPADVNEAAESCLDAVKATPPLEGFEAVTIPGELERRRRASGLEQGIALAPYLVTRLREEAGKLSVISDPL